jgi:N-acetylmuramate 1-kinase
MEITQIRQLALGQWLSQVINQPYELKVINPGAGVRRYYRVTTDHQTFVVMDAFGDQKLKNFIELADSFRTLAVRTPKILSADNAQGLLLLTDLGSQSFSDVLTADNVDHLYSQALTTLLKIQKYPTHSFFSLKNFDMPLFRLKMNWFLEYYLQRELQLDIGLSLQNNLQYLFDLLIAGLSEQSKTCVHYDYHCKNLMWMSDGEPGVLDFQDAVWGPITFDLMSLLRDCYIDWPVSRVNTWLQQYHRAALQSGASCTEDPALWQRWCDYSSAVRHIKCVGQFAHFHVTGYSSEYLIYIPRIIQYLKEVSARYHEMASLNKLLEAINP